MAVNILPKRDMSKSKTGCCPPFDPSDYDGKSFKFQDKLFVKISTRSFMHIPINMNSVMKGTMSKIENANASSDEYLMLSDEVSPWKAEHYIAVTKEVQSLEMTRLSGDFMAKVFEGEYKETPKWHQQLIEYVKSVGKTPIKTYFNYTMCPNCAKDYGHNYVVGFEQVQ